MAFIFPEDKSDFLAPNGVTYSWDGGKWVTKTFKADESALEDYVTKDDLEVDQEKQDVAWTADQERQDDAFAADQAAQDALIADNKRSIEELQITKGPVARYECKGLDFFLASRNGELYVNSATAADVTLISLAAFDLNGNPTRPVADGDIIEFVEAAAARNVGELSRFRITKGDDPQALEVVYLNGNNGFVVGDVEEVYIYPQNEETASKEYVDALHELNVKKAGSQLLDKAQWKLQQKDAGNTTRNFIEIHNSNMKLFHVQDCTDGTDAWAANKGYVDTQIAANAGSDYTLPTATTSTKGGVTSATNSGTYVPCTKMANTGSTIGVVQSTNTTQGVNYKGQACVTNQSTPNASDYQQGALIFSTSTNSLYIRT